MTTYSYAVVIASFALACYGIGTVFASLIASLELSIKRDLSPSKKRELEETVKLVENSAPRILIGTIALMILAVPVFI